MPRSASAEPPKASKRKGTRSVSTLTASQLARKRANDREAQRAIRARTKEHIERLERELSQLKSYHSRDKTVQELLRRNKFLEEELARLKEHMGLPITGSPYSAPAGTPRTIIDGAYDLFHGRLTPGPSVYEDNLSSSSGVAPSPRVSPLSSGDYAHIPEYSQSSFSGIPTACEPWTSTVPSAILSDVSSPSSPGHGEEFNTTYIPTSVPASMMSSGRKEIKNEFEDVERNGDAYFRHFRMAGGANSGDSDASLRLGNPMQTLPSTYMQHQQNQQPSQQYSQQPQQPHPQQPQPQRPQQWNLYPVYYQGQLPNSPNASCVSR